MDAQSKPTWLVNGYHAAACISTAEINRQLAAVYKNTDNFPKKWEAHQAVDGQKDSSGKDKVPRWKLDASAIGAPQVNFNSALVSGVQLLTTVTAGSFTHVTLNDELEAEWVTIKLDGIQFDLNTSMKSVTHEATGKETADKYLTVQSLYADLDDPKLLTSIDTSQALEFNALDDTKRSVAQTLLDMCKSDNYKKNYVFGIAKLPHVTETVGPFSPRYVAFTTYTGVRPGTLNWNLMVDEHAAVPTPPSSDGTAGLFEHNPLPDGVPGVMFISYGKIIEQLIVPKGLAAYNLTQDHWQSDPANARSCFMGSSVTLTDNKSYIGEFNSPNNQLVPDPANNRIRIDFQLDNVRQMKVNYPPANPHGAPPPPDWDYSPQPVDSPKYRVKWSGYVTFTLDTQGNLVGHYSQDSSDDLDVEMTDDEAVWMRVLSDIFSLGFHELSLFLDGKQFHSAIASAISGTDNQVATNLIKAVELPGGSVYTFDGKGLTWLNEGLRIPLAYQEDAAAGS